MFSVHWWAYSLKLQEESTTETINQVSHHFSRWWQTRVLSASSCGGGRPTSLSAPPVSDLPVSEHSYSTGTIPAWKPKKLLSKQADTYSDLSPSFPDCTVRVVQALSQHSETQKNEKLKARASERPNYQREIVVILGIEISKHIYICINTRAHMPL